MIFSCCDENRKDAILGNTLAGAVNGIDYLEVLDHASPIASLRQRTLLIHCLKEAPTTLTIANILIQGGESVTDVAAQWISRADPVPTQATGAEIPFFQNLPEPKKVLVVRTNEYGDFSPYTLRLVESASAALEDTFDTPEALHTFDPQLSEIVFSFKVECGPHFDCNPAPSECPPQAPPPPPINYLAKDYLSFRQVMLDRLNQLLPAWNATSEADIGVMMMELVAYAGDQLSYRQDAVTTEAYLPTARSRISLRRHALLVDYRVHDGSNARVWMQLQVSASHGTPVFLDRTKTRFYTTAPGMPKTLEVGQNTESAALIAGVVAFEPMQDAVLFHEHNRMHFYTWGDGNCCLPAGATSATLKRHLANLQVGDVLIFQEEKGPQTGFTGDADIRHRCAVRLTAVGTENYKGDPLVDPLFDIHGKPIATAAQKPQPVTEIQWSAADALPFPICISSKFVDSTGKTQVVENVCVALGNIVLADQGLSMPDTQLPIVPGPSLYFPGNGATDRCHPTARQALPIRYRPQIPDSPITQAVPLPLAGSPATSSAVPLKANSFVSLSDSNGFTTLMVAPDAPLQWPQYFGVVANINAGNPAEFDLAVVFAPPGVLSPPVLERFTGLSFQTAAANFVGTVLQSSRLITVPASYSPPAASPAAYSPSPTMLPDSGTVAVNDASSTAFLSLATTPPAMWPPLFGVVAQEQLQTPDVFNLLLVYSPQAGANGVTLPVIVEQFNHLSLATISSTIASASDLITVKSFEEGPSPSLSACELMTFDAATALPVIHLKGMLDGITTPWTVQPDLLASAPDDTEFVMEVDTDGSATLRFGDGTNGEIPDQGTAFTASYRIGNGTPGNVGANTLVNFAAGVLADSMISSCTNPLPAIGGIDPETNVQIRRRAPQAFMTQERAITMPDYVNVVEQNPQIEDAAATPRWTGSWYTVFITAEPNGNAALTKPVLRSLYKKVNAYRLAGEDVYIEPPQYVSLLIELAICVAPGYFQLDVEKALLQALGSGSQPCGSPGFFAAQNFILGQPVYLSPIYQAARAVAGVQTVKARIFEPQGQKTKRYIQQGYIPMNAFQVARLANDPSLPSHGRLKLHMQGGL
jgi:hypothetical protein